MVTKYYCNGNVSTFLLLALIYGHVTDTQPPTIVLGITLPSGHHPTLAGGRYKYLHTPPVQLDIYNLNGVMVAADITLDCLRLI